MQVFLLRATHPYQSGEKVHAFATRNAAEAEAVKLACIIRNDIDHHADGDATFPAAPVDFAGVETLTEWLEANEEDGDVWITELELEGIPPDAPADPVKAEMTGQMLFAALALESAAEALERAKTDGVPAALPGALREKAGEVRATIAHAEGRA